MSHHTIFVGRKPVRVDRRAIQARGKRGQERYDGASGCLSSPTQDFAASGLRRGLAVDVGKHIDYDRGRFGRVLWGDV